jgi:hypothetical protein
VARTNLALQQYHSKPDEACRHNIPTAMFQGDSRQMLAWAFSVFGLYVCCPMVQILVPVVGMCFAFFLSYL